MEQDNTQEQQIADIIAKAVPNAVKSALDDVLKAQQTDNTEQEQTVPQVQQNAEDNWLAPHLNPIKQHVDFATAAAVDYSKFYSGIVVVDSEDDLDELPRGVKGMLKSDADEVETEFNKLAKQGRATNRESIYQWLTGKRLQTEPEKVLARAEKAKAKKVNRAQQAVDVGSQNVLVNMSLDEIRSMPHEKLTEALQNIQF